MAGLHIDYRPQGFDEVIGNEATVKSLQAIFTRDETPHAFLFTGPSGCGKTTFGRLVKDMLECSNEDFLEINAADTRGIDTAREIISTCHYMPINGKVRVILIDECHQGTQQFLSALLKPLEDTPDHVYFILCTTDPQKLLKTIKTRCTTFEVEKLNDDQMTELINWVCECEETEMPDEVVEQIIDISDGCPREALVTLDQVISLKPSEMLDAAKGLVVDKQKVIDLCRAVIAKESWKKIMKIYNGLDDDPERIRRAILGYFDGALRKQANDRFAAIINIFEDQGVWTAGRPALTRMIYDATQ